MAHEYSVQIHEWISQCVEKTHRDIKTATDGNDEAKKKYLEGRLHEFQNIRQYLSDKIDLDTQTYYQ